MSSENTPSSHNANNNSNFGAYFLIAVGGFFLLKKLNWMPDIIPLITEWWSVIFILVGVTMLAAKWLKKMP